MLSTYGACIAVLALVPACFHVTLDPVPPSATPAQRGAAYRRLRPASQTLTVTVTTSRHGTSVEEATSMALADGTDVHHADDLLPVVGPASPSGRAAQRSRAARYGKWFFGVGGGAVFIGGALVAMGGVAVQDPAEEEGFSTTTYVGAGITVAGAIMVAVSRLYYARAEEHARRAAFATYDESLRDTLRVCVDGLQVTDCQAAPPGLSSPR